MKISPLISRLAFGGWRAFAHKSNVMPALVTPADERAFRISGDLPARLYRVSQESPSRTVRAGRD